MIYRGYHSDLQLVIQNIKFVLNCTTDILTIVTLTLVIVLAELLVSVWSLNFLMNHLLVGSWWKHVSAVNITTSASTTIQFRFVSFQICKFYLKICLWLGI